MSVFPTEAYYPPPLPPTVYIVLNCFDMLTQTNTQIKGGGKDYQRTKNIQWLSNNERAKNIYALPKFCYFSFHNFFISLLFVLYLILLLFSCPIFLLTIQSFQLSD